MRYILPLVLTSAYVFGMSAISFAGPDTIGNHGVQHKDDARDTMQELERRGQEKVDQAKGESSKPIQIEEIQTRSKEDINNKIDAMKEGVMGNR